MPMGLNGVSVMSAQADQRTHTTLWVSKETASHLEELKPFDSLTWDEWLAELAAEYEKNDG